MYKVNICLNAERSVIIVIRELLGRYTVYGNREHVVEFCFGMLNLVAV